MRYIDSSKHITSINKIPVETGDTTDRQSNKVHQTSKNGNANKKVQKKILWTS